LETEELFTAIQKAADTIANPNWAAIMSALASILAVIVAGIVAWKQYGIAKKQNEIAEKQADIADKQNKISLFERRYSAYKEIVNVLSLARDFNYFRSCTLYKYFIGVLLTLNYPEPQSSNPNTFVYHARIDSTTSLIEQSTFLFPSIQKDDADELSKKFRHFFVSIETSMPNDREKNVSEYYEGSDAMNDFFNASKTFSNKYLKMMEEFLSFERC